MIPLKPVAMSLVPFLCQGDKERAKESAPPLADPRGDKASPLVGVGLRTENLEREGILESSDGRHPTSGIHSSAILVRPNLSSSLAHRNTSRGGGAFPVYVVFVLFLE